MSYVNFWHSVVNLILNSKCKIFLLLLYVSIVAFIPINSMCLQPLQLRTNAKYVDIKQSGTRLFNFVNCGTCAECQKSKHLEYYLRTSAEYYNTIEKGGYVYWETLTYNDDCIPHLKIVYDEDNHYYTTSIGRGWISPKNCLRSNFVHDTVYVFNRDDYRAFFKRLRTRLDKLGYGYRNIKYFFVSEYGETTMRPHYHCIFFVSNPNITPEILDTCIRKSWTYGQKFDDKTLARKVLNGLGACNYVAKYVNKDPIYKKLLDNYIKTHHVSKVLERNIRPFHIQSFGYGENLHCQNINTFDIKPSDCIDLALEKGKCYLVDQQGLKTYPLPLYNIRKLFYDLVKDSDGKLHWEINDRGVHWKENLELDSLQKVVNRLQRQIDNVNCLSTVDYILNPDLSFIDYKSKIYNYLNGRDAYDLAVYVKYFRGRLYDGFMPKVNDVIKYDTSHIYRDYSDIFANDDLLHYNPNIFQNNLDLGYFVCKRLNNFILDSPFSNIETLKINGKNFLYQHTIDERTFTAFRDFDKVLELLDIVNRKISVSTNQKYEDEIQFTNRINTFIQKLKL